MLRVNTTILLLLSSVLMLTVGACRDETGDSETADRQTTMSSSLEDSPRPHEWVQISTESGRTMRAYLVYPQVSKPVPSVVVIHKNRGLNDWVRSVSDQLAQAGYVALAPDFFEWHRGGRWWDGQLRV